jgi:pyruvate dehydrogenase E2 component (dihydrolipoamide acetyltransferase)
MAYIVRVPGLGMQQDRATVVEWHAAAGDSVSEGELIAEIETEKSTFEIEAKEDGVLRRVYADVGDVRKPNQPLGIVAGADETITALESKVESGAAGAETGGTAQAESEPDATAETGGTASTDADGGSGTTPSRVAPRARKRADELGIDLTGVEGTGPGGAVTSEDVERAAESGAAASESEPDRVAPRARRRADELGIDLVGIEGSGPGGAVTVDDVEAASEQRASGGGREERPFSEMRRTIAQRLQQSYRDAVHVTLDRSADAEALLEAADAAAEALGTDVSILDVLLVALSATLREHPEFNATVDGDTLTLYETQNVGVAVDFERGLVAPVLEDLAGKSLAEVAVERRELTERVLADEFTSEDLQGGTFTVTNLGPYGVESFDPIINPPQVAILGVNALEDRMTSSDGTRRLRRHLPLSLSFDHRAVDGADAARFLETLVGHLEDPRSLLPDSVTVPTSAPTLPERSASAQTAGGLEGVVTAGSFEWSFDEPGALGGSGTAPSPVDYLIGSLASCLAASVGFQARKREVDLDAVRVEADGRPGRGSLEEIDVTVVVASDADDESLDRLVTLGERGCHVSETIRDDLVAVTWERD